MLANQLRDMPLRKKLFLSILAFIILPLAVTALFFNHYFSRLNTLNMIQTSLQVLKQTQESFARLINEADNLTVRILSQERIQTLLSYDDNAANPNYLENVVEANRWLHNEVDFCQYIDSVTIFSKNDTLRVGSQALDPIPDEMVRKAVSLQGMGFWKSTSWLGKPPQEKNNYFISYYRAINSLNMLNKNLAVERITIRESSLFQIYSKLNTYKGGEMYLLDADGTILSSTDKRVLGLRSMPSELLKNLAEHREGYFESTLKDKTSIVLYYTLPGTGWKMAQVIPYQSFLLLTNTVNLVIFITLFFCLSFGILFSVIQDRTVLKPLKQLEREMKKLKDGNFDVKLVSRSGDEIGQIIREYGNVIGQLKEMINKVYVSKMKQREAELIAVEAQINPHFLYNTLDSIRWLALKEKNYMVAEQLETLSEMFRHVLHNGREIVTVREEMNFINDYMFLQHAKYGSRINLIVRIDEALYDCLIPKLILQPLVENAMLHGLEPKLEGGRVEVAGWQEGETIRFSVRDDGIGANEEAIREMLAGTTRPSKVFALKNIDERIKLHYGEKYGLRFSGETGRGVEVEICIPLTRKERGEQDEITGG